MKKYIIYILITLGFFLIANQGYSKEINKSLWVYKKGAKYYNPPASVPYSPPSYKEGTNEFRFIMTFAAPKNWKNEYEINEKIEQIAAGTSDCHIKDEWRWETLEEYNPAVIILAWENVQSHKIGWCAIKNTADHWYISSDNVAWTTQKDFTPNDNMIFEWINNETRIRIHIRNPKNENGWTKHDILYKFTFPKPGQSL